ncbi:MAG: cytochrome d ubiquinol oxidase subunit II [Methylocystis sp.]
MLFDYGTLRIIWWALLGALLIGFAIMDGFDLGVAMLYPFVPRSETQRRVLLNVIGPVWEGNQVWFILGGGAIFAAWPLLYAASFSGFYLAMMLVLFGLILRPVALTFRGKIDSSAWRRGWDIVFFVSGVVPSLVFGVAFGNLLLGTPFHFDNGLQLEYEGGLLGLLNPFALLCGAVSIAMLTMQGASFLAAKSEGEVALRAAWFGAVAALILVVLLSVAGAWVALRMDGLVLVGDIDPAGPSNPLWKSVTKEAGGWLNTFRHAPLSLAAPIIAYLGALGAAIALATGAARLALVSSSMAVAGVIATAGFSLFPFLLPSSSHPDHSLTVWDASSSPMTLSLMLVATLFFLPIVLVYTSWVFYILRGPVSEAGIERGDDYHY